MGPCRSDGVKDHINLVHVGGYCRGDCPSLCEHNAYRLKVIMKEELREKLSHLINMVSVFGFN